MNVTSLTRARLKGRYELGPLLGRGGMAEVHEAWDVREGRRVAVKRLRPDLEGDAELRRRFDAERRVIGMLPPHPNLMRALDEGEEAGVAFIVLEYLEGATLRDRLDKGRLSVAEARRLAAEMLDALAVVHRVGLVHLDVKPHNIFQAASSWKLGDFGVAVDRTRRLDPGEARRVLGTPDYVAPELLRGWRPVPANDLFALGVVLFEAIGGVRPVAPASAAQHTVEVPPPRLTSLRPGLDDALAATVSGCLELDPRRRFASVAAARAALTATGSSVTQRLPAVDDTVAVAFVPTPIGARAHTRRRARPRLGAMALAGSLLFGGALAALVATSQGGGGPSRSPQSASTTQPTMQSAPPLAIAGMADVSTTTTPPPPPPGPAGHGDGHGHGGGDGHGDHGGPHGGGNGDEQGDQQGG